MDYRKELDALKAETAAIVTRLSAPLPELIKPTVPVLQASIDLVLDDPHSSDFARSDPEQISERIRNFRAHQERVRLEREDYYFRTMQWTLDVARGRRSEEPM